MCNNNMKLDLSNSIYTNYDNTLSQLRNSIDCMCGTHCSTDEYVYTQ
jgi:hypothetical protein